MKYVITAEQRGFFIKNQYLELEAVFQENEIEDLHISLERTIADEVRPLQVTNTRIFDHGYNISRKNPLCEKMLLNKSFALFAKEFCQKKSLIFGFDQYYAAYDQEGVIASKEQVFSLEKSSIQGALCGALICVAAPKENVHSGILPTSRGSILFMGPQFSLPYVTTKTDRLAEYRYLLFVWADIRSRYVHNEADPQTHALKRLGYVFGDRVKQTTHPLLIK